MKTILLTAMFAAGAAAQDPGTAGQKDPRVELALPIALEEQEGDLAKAEAAYRKALDGELSPPARWLAMRRLGGVLQQLGRVAEAEQWLARAAEARGAVVVLEDVTEQLQGPGHDPAREAALREKARALIEQVVGHGDVGDVSEIPGMSMPIAEQLLWIGEPSVPEIVAKLEAGPKQESAVTVLFRALWRIGGEQAEAYLARAANGRYARTVASTAAVALVIDVRSPAARACLRHPDPTVAVAFLQASHGGKRGGKQVVLSVPVAELVEVAEQGAPSLQAFVLRSLRRRPMADEELARVHELVRRGLAGTDPHLGQAAEEFLTGEASQRSLLGVTMLLERLPALHAKGAQIDFLPKGQGRVVTVTQGVATTTRGVDSAADRQFVFPFDVDAARAMVPRIDAAVGAVDPARPGDRAVGWLYGLMRVVITALGEEAVPHVRRWWDAGFRLWPDLEGFVTAANVVEVFARYDRVQERAGFLRMLAGAEIPSGMFEALLAAADREQDPEARALLGEMMVKTGRGDVVPWLLRVWRDDRSLGDWTATRLVEVGRRDTSPAVRDAFDQVLRGDGGAAPGGRQAVELLLAWLSMGDPRALDRAAEWPITLWQRHPYAKRPVELSPIQYLIYENPDPPHGYTEQQITDTVKRYLAIDEQRRQFSPIRQSIGAIRDVALAAIAEVNGSDYDDGPSWRYVALQRFGERLAEHQESPALQRWFELALGGAAQEPGWFDSVPEEVVARYGERIAGLVEGHDVDWADRALAALRRHDRPVDFVALLHSRHGRLRMDAAYKLAEHPEVPVATLIACLADDYDGVRLKVAEHLGALVAIDAVPALIGLLRDPDAGVREAAAQALTRIRFYHEQQAHWDRVLKGLDAGPASAAERLLLQAKPGEAKAQRLLAIESLGVLGVPEALPFLIDWTKDADAEIAAAAKAAITKIHLEPRR